MPLEPCKIVGHRLCPYVQRVVIVMIEKGIAFERIDIDLDSQILVAFEGDLPVYATLVTPRLAAAPARASVTISDIECRKSGSVLAVAPAILLFVFLQRYIVGAFVAGALKG